MAGSIIVDHLGKSRSDYFYDLQDSLFSRDISLLLRSLSHAIGQGGVDSVTVDISDADSVRFKPNRLFGFLQYLSETSTANQKSISFRLVVNEKHASIFTEMQKIPGISILIRPETSLLKEETSSKDGLVFRIFEWLSHRGLHIRYHMFEIQPGHLVNYIVWPLLVICSCLFAISLMFFQSTLYGFALLVVSGVLLFESFLVLRIFYSDRRVSKRNMIGRLLILRRPFNALRSVILPFLKIPRSP